MKIPLSYNARSLLQRPVSTAFTALGIGLVVAGGAANRGRHHVAPFFSSPGRMYSAPSQGLMKSKSRYSWVSFTGS